MSETAGEDEEFFSSARTPSSTVNRRGAGLCSGSDADSFRSRRDDA
jgi:hypothetical protein